MLQFYRRECDKNPCEGDSLCSLDLAPCSGIFQRYLTVWIVAASNRFLQFHCIGAYIDFTTRAGAYAGWLIVPARKGHRGYHRLAL